MLHKANLIWGAVIAALTAVFGKFWFLFAAFLALNLTDYITGLVKAYLTSTENSNKGLRGICKKVGYWIVIAIAFFISLCLGEMGTLLGVDLGFTQLAGWFCLATFIINEIRSVLENLVIIGVDVPEFLIRGLEVASNKLKKNDTVS